MTYRVRIKVTGRRGSAHVYEWSVAWNMVDALPYPFSGITGMWEWAN